MPQRHTKAEAEAVLRELPSVIGAFVREDVYGHPREVHLLVRPGTAPRDLARDVRDLLEERLGVPIDQRIISIAQLAADAVGMGSHQVTGNGPAIDASPAEAPPAPRPQPSAPAHPAGRAEPDPEPEAEPCPGKRRGWL